MARSAATAVVVGLLQHYANYYASSGLGDLSVVNGAIGMKVNAVGTLLVTFNMLFRVNDAGLRTKATPLIGMEYGF